MQKITSFICLLAGAQGLLFSLALILSGMHKKKPHLFLGIILAVCSIELLNAAVMPLGYHRQPNAFPFWIFGSYLLIPPSLAIFLELNTAPGYTVSRRHWLLFVPAMIEVLTEVVVFYMRQFTGADIALAQTRVWSFFTEILPLGWTIAVLIRHWVWIQQSTQTDAAPNRSRLVKQYAFLLLFTVLTMLWAADSLLHFQVYPVIEVLLCAALFLLGYIVYFIPTFFETPAVIAAKTSPPAFSQYNDQLEWQRLRQLFEVEKRHRQPRLTLEEVAAELSLPARYVSGLINQQSQTNFTTFVNTYRVKEVIERIRDPRENHKTLLGLALDSGFNSKSSFNQLFKTITGETPSVYLAKQKAGTAVKEL